jgi:hypothetical protein
VSQSRPPLPIRHMAIGLASCIPGIYRVVRRKGTGNMDSAAYCYGVWLKHLTFLSELTGPRVPRCVAEVGPGDSLGVGIAALLSGADRYFAFDVHRYATDELTLALFDQLVALFQGRAPRPERGWPDFDGLLSPDLFPHAVLDDRRLAETLRPERLEAIRAALRRPGVPADGILVEYRVPWDSRNPADADSVDLVLSHSCLEHVVDVPSVINALAHWLAPGAWMSHQVDFSSHALASTWNGHWAYGDAVWRVIMGKRPFLINRATAGFVLDSIRACGFELNRVLRLERVDGLPPQALAPRFRLVDPLETRTVSLFVQARKPSPGEAPR